jgi:DeoR/GlpR family transcriptional regulator of sugar metabolism
LLLADKKNREIRLLELLKESGSLSVSDVISELGISEATARRLFAKLEDEKKLIRIHGGIRTLPAAGREYSYVRSSGQRNPEKARIGKAAAAVVQSGDRIFIDSGTTLLKFSHALSLRIKTGEITNVRILTNSIASVESLAEACEVTLAGGVIRPVRMDVCGPLADKNLRSYCFDKAFCGADGITLKNGFMATDEHTASMNGVVIERSAELYVLADSVKFESSSLVAYTQLDKVTAVFTDSKLSSSILKKYEKYGIRIVRV